MAEDRNKPGVAPLLNVRRGGDAIQFYKAAFGATEVSCIASPDGEIVAAMEILGSVFWLADESPEHHNPSPETLGGTTLRMVLVADDPDAMFARAVSAGAVVVRAMVDESYGWRVGRVVDPFGHHWEIAKPLA